MANTRTLAKPSGRVAKLQQIFNKTGGHCHYCGDELDFECHGLAHKRKPVHDTPAGWWEIDHINQLSRGGQRDGENCLPACVGCNRLRWHRGGSYVRTTMRLGLLARDMIKDGGEIGRKLLNAAQKSRPLVTDWPKLGVRKPKH